MTCRSSWHRRLFVIAFLVGVLTPAARARSADTDAEYRKLERILGFLRGRNAQAFPAPKDGIAEARYVRLGGIDQWITIRGQRRDNPVLLFLHGGPGDVTTPWAYSIFAPWEAHFTVVQWDQRGAGRTLRRSGASIAATLTLDRMAGDGIELAEHLRVHLKQERITIVGHSFGSILGLRMAKARPDLFAAFVGTGQVGDNTRNYAVAYEALLAKARALGHQRAIAELTDVGPPPYRNGRGFTVQRTWSNAFEGADRFLPGTLGLALVAPGGSVRDVNDALEGQLFSGEHLVPQTARLGPADLGRVFDVPIFVFQGAEDFTTPTSLAREFVDRVEAPRKAFVAIEGGGHFAVFMHGDRFLRELVERVRPIAAGTPVPAAGAGRAP